RFSRDWSSDVCSSDLSVDLPEPDAPAIQTTSPPRISKLICCGPFRAPGRRALTPCNCRYQGAPGCSAGTGLGCSVASSVVLILRSEERRVGKGCRCWV